MEWGTKELKTVVERFHEIGLNRQRKLRNERITTHGYWFLKISLHKFIDWIIKSVVAKGPLFTFTSFSHNYYVVLTIAPTIPPDKNFSFITVYPARTKCSGCCSVVTKEKKNPILFIISFFDSALLNYWASMLIQLFVWVLF